MAVDTLGHAHDREGRACSGAGGAFILSKYSSDAKYVLQMYGVVNCDAFNSYTTLRIALYYYV